MADRTWTDNSGNHRAKDPRNWDPSGAPQPGDKLSVGFMTTPDAVINVSRNDLAGNELAVFDPNGTVAINTRVHAQLPDLNVVGSNVTLDVHGSVSLNTLVQQSNLHASGGTIRFIGSNLFRGPSQVEFDNNLVGSARLDLSGGGGEGVAMEVNGHVSSGLTFAVDAAIPVVSLQIDHPKEFKGQIELPPAPGLNFVAFMGLHVTSADLRNDMLFMFNGHRLVDAIQLSGGSNLQLEQNGAGVILSEGFASGQPGGPGTSIPLNISKEFSCQNAPVTAHQLANVDNSGAPFG